MLAGAVAAASPSSSTSSPKPGRSASSTRWPRFNYPGGAGALRYIEDNAENPMRAIGTMVDPNVLGGFLILITGLTLPQLVSPQPLFRRWWIAAFLGVELLALYLTYSRGSLVGLAAGLVVIGLLRYRKLLLVGVPGRACCCFLPPGPGVRRALHRRHPAAGPGDADAAGRVQGCAGADQPLSLVRRRVRRLARCRPVRRRLQPLSADGRDHGRDRRAGVPRWSLAGYLRSLWRRLAQRPRDPRLEALLLGLGAAMIGGMVGGIFDHYLFNLVYPHMSVLLLDLSRPGHGRARRARCCVEYGAQPPAAVDAQTEVVPARPVVV